MYCVTGVVYLIYHVLIEKSIIWKDFNLQDEDWELLQIGLVLLFLQVNGRRTENDGWTVGLHELCIVESWVSLHLKIRSSSCLVTL